MSNIRRKIVIRNIKISGLLHQNINEANLATQRRKFAKLERYFPVTRSVKIKAVHMHTFKGEWLTTKTSRKDKVMLYIHGGGFVFNSTRLHRDLISRIAAYSGTTAFSLDYSLAPEHPYPVALNEALAAYKWLLDQGFGSQNLVLAGDSAGGALALSLLHRIKSQGLPLPACVVVMSPATDATLSDPTIETNRLTDFYINPDTLRYFIKAYFADTPTSDPVASPLLGSLKGFPPLLIHVDKGEVMYSDSLRFAHKAKRQNVEVEFYESEGLFHVWHIFARYMPEAKKSIKDIGQFMRRHLRS